MEYLVSKGGLASAKVSYRCPECGAELTSPIEDAGSTDRCSECQRELVVPGEVELMRLHVEAERSREAERARRREAEERRKRQAAGEDITLDYGVVQRGNAIENARQQREAAEAIARMQRPGEYKEVVTGAEVVGVMGTVCYVAGFVEAGVGLILFLAGWAPPTTAKGFGASGC